MLVAPPIVKSYSREQRHSLLPATHIPSNLPVYFEFPVESTGDVGIACMLNFSENINVYRFIAQVLYGLAQALMTSTSYNIGIFIMIVFLFINFTLFIY